MKIQVRLNNYRRSARKVREIIPVIKRMKVSNALEQLDFIKKASAYDLKKLLLSGIATAENDFNIKKENLIVGEVMVQEGKTLKRWRARAYGRAAQILKRTCHILLTVEEKKASIDNTVQQGNKKKSLKEKVSENLKRDLKKKKIDKQEKVTGKDKKSNAKKEGKVKGDKK